MEVIATAIREEKEIKGIQTGKEEVKLSLLADDVILYKENPKDVTRKLLELSMNLVKLQNTKLIHTDFPGGAVIKNLPANAGNMGLIPGPGKIPHAAEQLSPRATTTEPMHCNY